MSTLSDIAVAACRDYAAESKEIARLANIIKSAMPNCKSDDDTHLAQAYELDVDDDGCRRYLSPEDQLEVLSACPHCLEAHNAIQDRKAARKRLGIAKRAVSRVGKAVLREEK